MKDKEFEKIFKALGNRRRIAMVRFIKRVREANVGMLAREMNLSLPATSRHLSILEKACILEKTQRNREVFYHLASPTPSCIDNFFSEI